MNKIEGERTYTGKDLLAAAREMMKKELETMQGRKLSPSESEKIDQLASGLSYEVLKDMGVVA